MGIVIVPPRADDALRYPATSQFPFVLGYSALGDTDVLR
jgi:hypothetical protein